ncbi:MAG: GSCFA domain-containing protein [Burkholderiales bacterium]
MSRLRRILRSVIPLWIRNLFRDLMERAYWHSAGSAADLPKYGLTRTQVYPFGRNFIPVLREATAGKLNGLALTPTTPVASIGTCFAEEFAIFMRKHGYNYISTEPDVFYASAKWGRVYTIPNFLQIVRYSFEQDFPLEIEKGPTGWFDATREHSVGTYASKEAAESAIQSHRIASREAFSSASVLILTVGQNEAWVDVNSGLIWAQIPPRETLHAEGRRFEAREFTYEENTSALVGALETLFRISPRLQVLITVSPVASYATFCDTDVVSQSLANKCLLRIVVRDVLKRYPGKVFYFPSFEMVLGLNQDSFRADNRHVKHARVDKIFETLKQTTGLMDR